MADFFKIRIENLKKLISQNLSSRNRKRIVTRKDKTPPKRFQETKT